MSSNRLQTTEIQSNEEKSNSTHWVCCFANESLMKKQADLWIGNCNTSKGKYEKASSKSPIFDKIKNVDVLHIYGHGEKNNSIIYHGDTPLKPADFLKYLKNNKLDSGHKYLEINACYSDTFAKEFAEIAIADFPDLRVTGYPGQFVPCQGNNGENLANLKEPFVIKIDSVWEVNRKVLNKSNISEYYAEKYRKDFYTNPGQKQEIVSAELKSADVSSSSATTSNPNVISHPYQTRRASTSSYTGYESTTRESLPGRKSWSEILAQVTPVSSVEILGTNSVTDQLAALNMTEPSREDTESNAVVEEPNSSTSAPKLNLEKSENDDIIPDNRENSPPTLRK